MNKSTDWDRYYENPSATSAYSRFITSQKIIKLIKKYCHPNPDIVELGGANSCFYSSIKKNIFPRSYTIVDNNQLGLDKTKFDAKLICLDVLNIKDQHLQSDLVFSVGLIEHFNELDTAKAISSHFKLLEKNGICLITFPTPTWLYKLSRGIAERLNLWAFPDERPLTFFEVETEIKKHGQILYKTINWPIFFTQGIIIAQKI